MTITEQPITGQLYFQKNIPDVMMVKSGSELFANFVLSVDGVQVLNEKYFFDYANNIRIRNISEVVEKYFAVEKSLLNVSYTVIVGSDSTTVNIKVLKCESDMGELNAGTWCNTNFLTRAGTTKRTAINRNEYLSFLQKSAYGTVSIHAKVTFNNGLIVENQAVLKTIQAAASDCITTFNASLATVQSLSSGFEIYQYEIWLTGSNFESVHYKFQPDYSIYRDKAYLVFVNAFGVLETFTPTGRKDTKKSAEYGLGNIENQYQKATQNFIVEHTINSGYLSELEMNWIDDLLISSDVALYAPGNNGMKEEITLTNVDKIDTQANELQAFRFEYRKSIVSNIQFVSVARRIFDNTFNPSFE